MLALPGIGLSPGRLPLSRNAGGEEGVSAFLASAQRILSAWESPQTVDWSPAVPPVVDVSGTGNSTVTGRTLAAGGIVATPAVPDGWSGPMNADSRWIVTKAPSAQVESNRTFAPGNSKLFVFTGQKFDFKAAVTSGTSFSIRWSEDGGVSWGQTGPYVMLATCWALVDFGSAAPRIVEVICEDQSLQTYGWNFDTGAVPEAWSYDGPRGAMLGDSYVFGQGSRVDGLANNQQATLGMARKMAEYLGFLQTRNHGFRTNGFSNDHAAAQSKFKDRIDLPDPADHALSEALVMGAMDFVVVQSSVNDDGSTFDGTRETDVAEFFRRLRSMQPNALILFAVGARPPDVPEGSNWLAGNRAGFNAVFGETEAQWIGNGACLLDGSRGMGDNWIPAGGAGSSAYYPASGDTEHPNAAGHAYFAEKYGDGLLYLAQGVAA